MVPTFRRLSLFLLSGLLAAATTHAADGISKRFAVADGGRLTVRAEGAKLEVSGRDAGAVEIDVLRGRDSGADIERDFEVDFAQRGSDVSIEVRRKRPWRLSNLFGWRSLELDIKLPRRFNLDLETSGGSVAIAEIEGDVRAQTSGGSITFEAIDGQVIGRTSGGSIRLSATTGDADVRTSGGSIHVGKAQGRVTARTSGGGISIVESGGAVSARTSGGSIEVEEAHGAIEALTSGGSIRAYLASQPSSDSRLTTSGGSVTVYLDPKIAVDVDASASGGRASSDLPFDGTSSRSRLQGTLNGGGPRLYLRAAGGSVSLREY